MYIFKNALKNIVRNRSRNTLLATIIFAIITTTVVALMINNTAGNIIDDYKNRFGSKVTISPNMKKYIEATQNKDEIIEPTPEQYIAFAKSDYIQSSILSNSASCASSYLKAVGESSGGMMGSGYVTMPTMRLLGNNWQDFENGFREVIEGNMPQSKNDCIISNDFAELNTISVGDTIQIEGMVLSQDEGLLQPVIYHLLVTGVYFDATDPNGNSIMPSALMNRRNEILTVFETLQVGSAGMSVSATYYLKNPTMQSDFDKELRSKGLSDIYEISVDEAGYKSVVGPVEGLRSVSITFMIVVLILGAIILVFLSSMAIRERKYEIGVLRAMGMKKHKVALGIWTELVVITMCCLVIGIGAGTLVSQPVTDTLLTQQIASLQESKQSTEGDNFIKVIDGSSSSVENPIDELDVSLGVDTAVEIIIISLLLASIAGVVAISNITKYEPIKILMERN